MTTSWPHSRHRAWKMSSLSSQAIYLGGEQGSVGGEQNLRTCPSLPSPAALWGPAHRAQVGAGSPRAEAQWPVLGKLPLSPAQPSCPFPTGPLSPALLDAGSEVINWQDLWGGVPRACAQPGEGGGFASVIGFADKQQGIKLIREKRRELSFVPNAGLI